jgi:cysteine-rich repeat protein
MNASLRTAVPLLCLALACGNRAGADLFDDAGLPTLPAAGNGGVGNTGGGSSAGSGATSAGEGGTTSGSAGKAGSAAGGNEPQPSDGGEPSTPDNSGGASDGAGGKPDEPEPPEEPECGNGKLEAGEECDDGGKASEDGCSECKVVCAHFASNALKSEDFHCYAGFDEADFDGAQADCVERGAHLATISSAAENQLVRELVNTSKLIGGLEDVELDVKGEGTYEWITGEPLVYENWATGQPDQKESRCGGGTIGNIGERCYEHCMTMNGQGQWEDRRCDQADGYVCEWEPAGQ